MSTSRPRPSRSLSTPVGSTELGENEVMEPQVIRTRDGEGTAEGHLPPWRGVGVVPRGHHSNFSIDAMIATCTRHPDHAMSLHTHGLGL